MIFEVHLKKEKCRNITNNSVIYSGPMGNVYDTMGEAERAIEEHMKSYEYYHLTRDDYEVTVARVANLINDLRRRLDDVEHDVEFVKDNYVRQY